MVQKIDGRCRESDVLRMLVAAPASATCLNSRLTAPCSTKVRLVQPSLNTATETVTDLLKVECVQH